MPKPLWGDLTTSRPAVAWREVVTLTPKHVDVVPQYAVQLGDGGWGMTQGRDNGAESNAHDDLILSRFEADGTLTDTREVERGGHGDRCAVTSGGRLATSVRGVWAEVRFGSPWSWRGTSRPKACSWPVRWGTDLQGEVHVDHAHWLRLYGQSQKGGSERDPSHAFPLLEVLTVVDKLNGGATVYALRDVPLEDGLPIGGRYEPEGVSVGVLDGERVALVGFAIGRLGHTVMRVWACPLAALL